MRVDQLYKVRSKWVDNNITYTRTPYLLFNYKLLNNAMYYKKRGRGQNSKVNEVFIMGDTETSKKKAHIYQHNHVCAFSIAIRMFNKNIVTLYGHKPSECIDAITNIHKSMSGEKTIIFFHNLNYDYTFLRKFMYQRWGFPKRQLAIKAHAPIEIEFENGIVLRDSLILAQRKLETWAKDMCVEHQKAVGKWDYNAIRNQDHIFTNDELDYIECDVVAGVECLNALAIALKKHVCELPLTATGIPREECRKRGKANRAKEFFNKCVFDFNQYQKATMVFHGGYTHANRYISGQVINEGGDCYDFSSSYPYVLLSEMYPAGKFMPIDDKPIEYILKYRDQYAFMFKLVMIKPHIKPNVAMPTLQSYKCVDKINPIYDNGRILSADYIEIYLNEIDLSVIAAQYDYDKAYCVEVEFTHKAYLNRWFTDYVYELYKDKCELKKVGGVAYALAKAKLNSLYGMCAMRNVRDRIIEEYETGIYKLDNIDPEKEYNKYISSFNSILLYQTGVWCTSYAFRNLHLLGAAVANDGIWLYSDTDSCYATKWNKPALDLYNNMCKQKLLNNGYGAVVVDGKEFWLGIAEHNPVEDHFTEFITQGAKRYCKRVNGHLKITVAGVPKKACESLNDDIYNFKPGLVFDGKTSGKLTHKYLYVDEIYIDDWGNETGDSINLEPCDYLLSHDGARPLVNIEDLFNIEQGVQIYEEI